MSRAPADAPAQAPKRRFALVCPNYYPRICGVGDHTMRVAQELTRRGFETVIFTRSPAEANPEAPGVRVVARPGATPLLIAAQLQPEIEKFAPTDLIIQYTPHMLGASRWGSPATLWLAQAARRRGTNVVLLAHELYLPWSRRPDLAIGAGLMRLQLAALMKLCHRVLVTMKMRSEELSGLSQTIGLGRPVGVVRVGTSALPLPRKTQEGRLRMGMFSTLAITKRFDVMLDCFRIVQARRPEAELIILGDLGDPQEARVRALHKAIEDHPARAQIHVRGRQDLADIAREVAELDVYLFPMISGANTRSSTLPLALGTGLPIVAIDSYETDEVFVDGENVLFARELTGASFAEAVLRIAADHVLAKRLTDGARALYRDHLSWEKVGDQLLAQI